MIDKLKKVLAFVESLWGLLPAEIKVALYIAVSQGVAQVVVELGKLQVNNFWLGVGINILLVFLKELKPRIEKLNK